MFIDVARSRHSCRDFTSEPLTDDEKKLIVEAGDLAPSSKGRRPVRLVPIDDVEVIRSLSDCKDSGARAMETATFAVAVAVDPAVADTWVEDSSIATIMMQLEAEDLGIGSCWIQLRLRSRQGQPAETHTKEVLGLDSSLSVLSIVAFGRKA